LAAFFSAKRGSLASDAPPELSPPKKDMEQAARVAREKVALSAFDVGQQANRPKPRPKCIFLHLAGHWAGRLVGDWRRTSLQI
jgi:hypothetical protein